MQRDSPFARRAVHRVLSCDSNLRVSEGAVEKLQNHLEEVAEDVAEEASVAAKHADRKTVREEDLDLALGDA